MNDVDELKQKIVLLINVLQEDQDKAITRLKSRYPNVSKVFVKAYNVTNMFAQIGLRDERNFYSNLISDRSEFNTGSKSYLKILTQVNMMLKIYNIQK